MHFEGEDDKEQDQQRLHQREERKATDVAYYQFCSCQWRDHDSFDGSLRAFAQEGNRGQDEHKEEREDADEQRRSGVVKGVLRTSMQVVRTIDGKWELRAAEYRRNGLPWLPFNGGQRHTQLMGKSLREIIHCAGNSGI